jgi:trimeric autotransporter adhesin
MRASGGYRLFSNSGATAGVFLAPNGTAWATISDKNAKKDFAAVNPESVLDKLAAIPVEQWRYQWEDAAATPNIGPMAQDFKAAFYPGRDDKSITTLEFDGVELAAIQGLNRKLQQKDTEITELKQELAELKSLVQQLAQPK